jgi:hypothetical protein
MKILPENLLREKPEQKTFSLPEQSLELVCVFSVFKASRIFKFIFFFQTAALKFKNHLHMYTGLQKRVAGSRLAT